MTRAAALLGATLLAIGAGCASVQHRARAHELETRLAAVRYSQPLDDVWMEIRRLLAEKGYPLAAEDAKAVGQRVSGLGIGRFFSPARETHPIDRTGVLQDLGVVGGKDPDAPRALTLETGWKRTMDRYRADAFQEGAGVRVEFTRFVDDGTDRIGQPTRGVELELELARRLDPALAARVEGEAGPKVE